MRTILFLSIRMAPGWGVSVVAEHLSLALKHSGTRVIVGCDECEGSWLGPEIVSLPPDARKILEFVRRESVDVVVAQTSPYFEILPDLAHEVPCIAYEYGDPTPEFFSSDAVSRRRVVEDKRNLVYPAVSMVIAGSEFLRHDISWPAADILLCGCDHMPDLGAKGLSECYPGISRPLRIGTLARLGHGEAQYKGLSLYRRLFELCQELGISASWAIMGRGTKEDGLQFEREGMTVFLSATEREKADYLRSLDVFISCSQWEGFNLPLAEAAALGTAAIAFDVGAHPEVTPLLASNSGEVLALIKRYQDDRSLLLEHSRVCYEFVRGNFSWEKTAARFSDLVEEAVQRFQAKALHRLSAN